MSAAEVADATPPSAMLEHAIRALGRGLNGAAFMRALDHADAEGPAHLIHLWRHLEALRKVLDLAGREVQARLLPVVRDERVTVEDVGSFEWQGGTNRKGWDHERVMARIHAAAIDLEGGWRQRDTETGEVEPAEAALWRAVLAAGRLEYRMGSFDGKKPGLKALGIDPADYCTEEKGQASIRPTWADGALEELMTSRYTPGEVPPVLPLVADQLAASLEVVPTPEEAKP